MLIQTGEQCPYCTKFRAPADIIPMLGGAKICIHCERRHIEALHLLSTNEFTGECSECGKKADSGRGTGVMAVHYEGGKYRVMCLPCDAVYVLKRRDLYGGTEFAHSIGLS